MSVFIYNVRIFGYLYLDPPVLPVSSPTDKYSSFKNPDTDVSSIGPPVSNTDEPGETVTSPPTYAVELPVAVVEETPCHQDC